MSFPTITTVITQMDIGQVALDAAVTLAHAGDAHLDIICLGVDRTQPGFYHAGASAVAIQANLELAASEAQEVEDKVTAEMKGRDLSWAAYSMTAQSMGLAAVLSHRLRYSDLAVLPLPYGEGRGLEHESITEAALFDAHVPVLVIPDGCKLADPVRRVVVAWNEGAEALRAIRHALPFLKSAENVNIAVIDPPTHSPDRSDPGGSLSQMLSRHDVRAEVSVLARTLPRVSDVLARHVADQDADLLVMGAYGHSRFREAILGGSTRNMLEQAKLPVFMAH